MYAFFCLMEGMGAHVGTDAYVYMYVCIPTRLYIYLLECILIVSK